MDLLKSKFPTGNELKNLDLHEKELYDNVIHLAHLHKKAEHNLPQTRQSMKHRFELLNGEIGAGNTNKALKAELKQLVHKMAHGGMISHNNANKYLKSL
jgi:putative lipoic acid-binding regulatory protein